MGGTAAAMNQIIHISPGILVVLIGVLSLCLQFWSSYRFIAKIFRFLSLALLGYVVSMFLAKPDWSKVAGFLHPGLSLNRDSLSILVAMIGTSLSAYLFTWQSNQEVEEKIAAGKVKSSQRRGTSEEHLQKTLLDVVLGMFFSAAVMYSIIIATGATLFQSGHHDIQSASDAAKALAPLAGKSASLLFTPGIVGVGFLAIPVMTTGAAYDVCQTFTLRNGLNLPLAQGKAFYGSIFPGDACGSGG